MPLRHGGRERPYRLHVPEDAPDPTPLVVELHGRGIDALRFDRLTGFGALAAEAGFALALPDAVGEVWNDGRDASRADGPDDVAYLDALVADACARAAIDGSRIYLAGMSNGAAMAGRFACERADRIAAFAQVAGTAAASVVARARPVRPVPVLEIHGSADEVAPYAGGSRRSLRARLLVRRSFGESVGVDDWARFWAAANGAGGGPEVAELPPDTTVRTWRNADGVPVAVFYRIAGGGHTWPQSRFPLPSLLLGRTSDTFDATRAIWEFLSRNALP